MNKLQIKLTKKITPKNWIKATTERNKHYASLSRHGKVIELCKDSLFNILNGWVDVRHREGYCTLRMLTDKIKEEDFRTALPTFAEKKVKCMVCAKGSIFLSAISFKNELSVGRVYLDANSMLQPELKDAMTQNDYDTIEDVYENSEGGQSNMINGFNLHDDYHGQRILFLLIRIMQFDGNIKAAFAKGNMKKDLNISKAIRMMETSYKLTKKDIAYIKEKLKNNIKANDISR